MHSYQIAVVKYVNFLGVSSNGHPLLPRVQVWKNERDLIFHIGLFPWNYGLHNFIAWWLWATNYEQTATK